MSRFKFINIFDSVFLGFVIFFIIFAWVQFFVKQIFLSFFISIILALSAIFILRWLNLKKTNRLNSWKENQANLTKFKLAIQTFSSAKLSTLIKRLIPSKYETKTTKGDVVFIKNDLKHTFTSYYSGELTELKLLKLIKTKNTDVLIILCSSFSKDAKLICTAFTGKQIELITLEQLYELFDKNNIWIDTSHIVLSPAKNTLKQILKNTLSRDKSKKYFITGLILLFTSLIVPFKIYYVVFSSVLFVLCLVCRFKPRPKTNMSIFD